MTVSTPFQAQSLQNYGTQVAPGTGTDIAVLTTPPAGMYIVEIRVGFGATAEAAGTNPDNFQLMVGGVAHVRVLLNGANAANTGYLPYVVQIELDGTETLAVRPVAAASGGTNYKAQIIATRVS